MLDNAEEYEVKIRTAFRKAKLAEQEWMDVCLEANVMFGFTPEKIKDICWEVRL